MNYRTKIPIPIYNEVIPKGTELMRSKSEYSPYTGEYFVNTKDNGRYFLAGSVVESNPDIFEPERTWTDEEMIEFKFHHLFIEQGRSTLISGIGYEKEYLNHFAKLKGK